MIKISASVCIDAPAAIVWERLANLEDIQLWSEPVLHAECDADAAYGVGAQRTCKLQGGLTIRERWLEWEEGRSFTYEGFGIPMIKRATNKWSVVPQGDVSLLTTEAEVELRGGVLGRLLEPIMGPVMERMAPDALAGFKYLVEHGAPYAGKASELPRPVAAC